MRANGFARSIALLVNLPFALSQDSVSYNLDSYGQGDDSGTPYQTYMSNTDIKPPQVQINTNGTALADGYIFIGVDGAPTSGQNWPAIYEFSNDVQGSLIWTGNYVEPFDFKASTYKGEPVLSFWSGELLNGYGRGSFYVLNQSYAEIAHFQVNRFGDEMGDIHEFEITADDTALVAIYHAIPWDLSASGGISEGWLFENTIQEINIETGELVFEWNASTHVGINESYNSLPEDVGRSDSTPWDYFHINSIEKDSNGDFLVSARVMDCIYKISGADGHIIWRLQGKQSDFDVAPEAAFAFQHDARWLNDDQTRMTLFDNGPTEGIDTSRGLLLDVNQDDMTVRLIQAFQNGAKTFAQFEGSLQAIDPANETTNFILGYGNQPYFAELDHNGNILLDVQFGKTNVVNSYRAFKQQWQGRPTTKPDVHWDKQGNRVYYSWNGATDVVLWEIYTANTSDSRTWTNITTARRTGFETTVDLSGATLDTYVRGKALNSTGGTLGWTRASDGNQLFDAPDDVEEDDASNSRAPSSTSSSSAPSMTSAAPSSSSSGVAAKPTHGLMQHAFAAAVVVGGLAFV